MTIPISYLYLSSMGITDSSPTTAKSAYREVIMSIALFIESHAGELEGLPAKTQSLLLGYNNDVVIYNRVSNGTKGKGQAWKRITDTSTLPNEPIINVPVGVIATERDLDLVGLGQVTGITTKAIYANESAEPMPNTAHSHREAVRVLAQRLYEGDPTLAELVLDGRTSTGTADIEIKPMGVIHNRAESVQEQVEPIEQVEIEQTEQAPKELADMALKLVTIPDAKYGEQYINRRFDGNTDYEIFDSALRNGVNVLLEGEAGAGKTMSVQGYASKRKLKYFNIASNQGIDPSQLFGRWIPRADGNGYVWQDGAVTLLVRNGGVLLINEINFLPTRISTVLFSLLDYRREIQLLDNGGEVIKAHPDLLIVGDMNYGYKGTQELNQAFADRFGIKLEYPYDRSIESKIIKSKSVLSLADQLREQYANQQLSTPISTRSLVSFVDNANRFGVGFAITSFVNGFHKEERGGVRLACETHKHNIAEDLGQALPTYESHEDKAEVNG